MALAISLRAFSGLNRRDASGQISCAVSPQPVDKTGCRDAAKDCFVFCGVVRRRLHCLGNFG